MELLGRLVDGLAIGLLGDALPRQRAAQLVVHDLDLLVDEEVRDLDGGVLHRVVDDAVREAVTGAVEGVAVQPRPHLGPQGGQVGELAQGRRERIVGDRQDLLAELPERDVEVSSGALQGLVLVVERERDLELGRVARPQAHQVLLEAGNEALLADHDGHPLHRAALERLTVARPDEADHGPVVVLGAPLVHRHEGGLLVAQLVHDAVHLRVVDGVDVGREREGPVVAELDLRADRDRGRVPEWLALLRLDDVDRRAADREQLGLLCHRLAIGPLDELLDGLVEDRSGAQLALNHGSGRLPGPEPGDPGPLAQAAGCVDDGAGQVGGGQLDLEEDGALRGWGCGDVHGRPSIRAASGARPRPLVGKEGVEPSRHSRDTGS